MDSAGNHEHMGVGVVKVVILAGGRGSRLSEETVVRPKPMVEIGGRPMLWHIMNIYAAHGFDDFVVCLGYKGYVIKEYFANYYLHRADVTFDLANNHMTVHQTASESWRVTLVDTGLNTQTGGRLKRVLPYLNSDSFCLTYGDGVADVDVSALVKHHAASGALATVTAVQPPGRFGTLNLDGDRVHRFSEKAHTDAGWINGGFFVLSPEVERYIDGDGTTWERGPLEGLARDRELAFYQHTGFWHPMDTLRDREYLDALCQEGTAPWLT